MTKTYSDLFRSGQTRYSAYEQMASSENRPKVASTSRSTASHVGDLESMVRAQYLSASLGERAKVIVSVNPLQASQKAIIRGVNEELQGRDTGVSSTSLDFVLSR